ncbi:hypothetical protein [Risungbinella massiliensis]|uniref:hypothetical protein n=1 Tax=Risungbinella massiliensis TaxID=1329796 RepID=UPI0005CC48B6|nr:hypothetical protein [Risungbinella massiliensis]
MDIEIGYIPKHYFNLNPDSGGYFPFAIDGNPQYVFSMDGFYLPESDENFLPLWMEQIEAFPIYFCSEIPLYWKEDYEELCNKSNIEYKYLLTNHKLIVSVTDIENINQLREILPIFLSIGSSNDLVVWSTQDVFRVEKRPWQGILEGKIRDSVVVKIDKDVCVFWIGYDGDSIVVLTNNTKFSTYENICNTLPEIIKPLECGYE